MRGWLMEAFTVKETENECRKSLSFIEQTDRDGCSPRKQLIRTQSRIDEGFWADLQKQPEHRERKCKTLQNAWRQQFSIGKSNKSFRSLSKYILLCEHWVRFTKQIPSYKKDKHVCVCVFQHLPSRCLSTAWFWSQMLLNVLQRDRPSGRGFLRTHPPQAYW